ncbi:LysR family transcriptional regulator [Staphylococcus shinii]|uniref:LysR family transcriptional regulator n=1 Tax=Staphylococcus shinii TaxID=2912228 RepID=UPI001AAF833C|nr:LysR family transcriptional regulator [Staphylococcus shinii]MBO3064308.1 LysR family transcriptional regulator [Staphylococcus shinii]
MNIDYIEDFIKVAEFQSINHASSILNISTPALSKRIKHIENYFGCDLFYRTSRGIFLTDKGKIVLKKLTEIKSHLEKLKIQITDPINIQLRIGLLPSFSLYKLDNFHKNVLSENSIVKIENNTQILLKHLHNGDIDVLIGDISSTTANHLFTKPLYIKKYMIAFSNDNVLSKLDCINTSHLKEYKVFLLSPPCDTLTFVRKNFSELQLDIEHKPNLESLFASVKTNQGVTIIPQSLTTRLDSMDINYRPLEGYDRAIGLIAYKEELIDNVFKFLGKYDISRFETI